MQITQFKYTLLLSLLLDLIIAVFANANAFGSTVTLKVGADSNRYHTLIANSWASVQNSKAGLSINSDPIDIAEARNLPNGTLVTVSGRVTVADEFAGPVYIQDETAGIASFYLPVMRDSERGFILQISRGDSVVITGPITDFNGMVQIAPTNSYPEIFYDIYNEEKRDIEPSEITLSELQTGKYEGQLVNINGIRIQNQGQFVGDSNYNIYDQTAESELRISRFTEIPGMSIAMGEISIVGVAGRYHPRSSIDIMQLLPRDREDFRGNGLAPIIISDTPYEVSATSSSITFHWETDRQGTSEIRYGRTGNHELGILEDDRHKTTHQITLPGLDPATVYSVQLRSAYGKDTMWTSNYLVSTASPPGTTQEVNVYFNQDADHHLATFVQAKTGINFAEHLINRINEATYSIDLALYSIRGTVGNRIAASLITAYERDVAIRVIVDHTTDTGFIGFHLKNSGIAVIESNFGDVNQHREGIHHNKYAIIDYNGGDPENVWLITSSWNATDSGTHEQFQNMIEFQDVAIAGAYTLEFNQKWGSETTTPDASKALFGSRKQIVNPSTFWIGNTYIRLFFSPQGNTESAIVSAIKNSAHTINLSTMLITRVNITNELQHRHLQGVAVRGILGQPDQQGSQFKALASFADMHTQTDPLLHHKYAIIDGEDASWNGMVITGSHNWSASANQRNDENTIIIQDSRIANEYIQEFAARYYQAGGKYDIITTYSEPYSQSDKFIVLQNYPNPFNPNTRIAFQLPMNSNVTIHIYDMLGREVAVPLSDKPMTAGSHQLNFDGSSLAGGIYFYRILLDDGQVITKAMTLIK